MNKLILIQSLDSTDTLPARFKVSMLGQRVLTISKESEHLNNYDCKLTGAANLALVIWDLQSYKQLKLGVLPSGDHAAIAE